MAYYLIEAIFPSNNSAFITNDSMLVIGVKSVQKRMSLLVGIIPEAANDVIIALTRSISSWTILNATFDFVS